MAMHSEGLCKVRASLKQEVQLCLKTAKKGKPTTNTNKCYISFFYLQRERQRDREVGIKKLNK